MDAMPLPRHTRRRSGRLPLRDAGWEVLGADTPRLVRATQRLRMQVGAMTGVPGLGCRIALSCAPAAEFPGLDDNERYRLTIDTRSVRIDAPAEWGVLRALATLVQLVRTDAEGPHLPTLAIDDAPRFPWRGLMIDTARHFIRLDTLERTLDIMAFYKLNVLHLHLSDDQAFRFHCAAYPELAHPRQRYTRDELADLVREGADRGIRVVPELDVPGHVASWLAVHPDWGLGEAVRGRSPRFGVHRCCLDPDNADTTRAVETLFDELAGVFPDAYVHFGGDEVRLPGGVDIADLQAAFNTRLVSTLRALGKTPIAWDEALHPDLSRNVTVQAWRGSGARDRAIEAGFDTVQSAPYYLDLCFPADLHYLSDPAPGEDPDLLQDPRLAHVRPGLTMLNRTWSAVAGTGSPGRPPGRLLGGEACMWTELVTDELLALRVWSRMPAIAERLWSDASVRDVDNMYRRLSATHSTLAACGIADLAATTSDGLEGLGLTQNDIRDLAPLVDMLEPVKWYARLLGPAVMDRRASGAPEDAAARPYDATTPLDRVVDVLPPESLPARRLAFETDSHTLRAAAAGWRRQRACVARLAERHPAVAELDAVSAALHALGEQLDRHLDGETATVPEHALRPHGEYMLPIAVHLVARFGP